MTTDEWRQTYEQEGCVDLWVEEEFNSGSRLIVSSAASSCVASTSSGTVPCTVCAKQSLHAVLTQKDHAVHM